MKSTNRSRRTRSYTYSAPAKIILSGEHAVVYGKPALITALDLRLSVTVAVSNRAHESEALAKIRALAADYLRRKRMNHRDTATYRAHIKSKIPSGRNLGSSAALSVAASAAYLHALTDREPTREMINAVAYEAEKHFHGNPSGADNSTSCFGGLIYYRKEFEFLKHISALHAKLPDAIASHLLIIQTGKPKESTAEMVAAVGRKYNESPDVMEAAMNAIERATKKMTLAITGENPTLFAEAVVENQKQLEVIGVISERAKEILVSLAPYGVGKVTGGGGIQAGSGNLLFFAHDPAATRAHLDEQSIAYLSFVQDYTGVVSE